MMLAPAFLQNIGTWDLLIIAAIALLLFGSRLPEVARNLGRGMAQFKHGLEEAQRQVQREIEAEGKSPAAPPVPPAQAAQPAPQAAPQAVPSAELPKPAAGSPAPPPAPPIPPAQSCAPPPGPGDKLAG